MQAGEVLGQRLQGKSILLTGATGFVGSALVPQLLERGLKVSVFTRRPKVARAQFGERVEVLADLMQLSPAGYYGVVNLAGAPIMAGRWSRSRRELLLQSRVGTTSALLEHLRSLAVFPEVVISGSAIGFYGDTGEAPATEATPSGSGFAPQLCREWEAEARGFEHAGARLCLLRTGIVLGQGGGALAQMLPAFRLGLGGPIGQGQQWMSWIHRQDLIHLILWLLVDHTIEGPVNGTAPEPVRNADFTRALAEALGRPCWLRMPAWALKAALGQAAEELLLASNRVLPQKASSHAFGFSYPELAGALDNIVKKK